MNKYLLLLSVGCAVVALNSEVGAVNGTVSAVENVAGSVKQLSATTDSLLGTNSSTTVGNISQQVSQYGNAITSSSSDIANIAKVGNISASSVNELKGAINSVSSAYDDLGSLSSQVDKYLGTNVKDSITSAVEGLGSLDNVGNLTDGLDSLTGVGDLVDGVGSQLSGAVELMSNPQSLLTMGLGYVGWDKISKLSMDAAMDAVTDFVSVPNVGIPVQENAFTASNAADKAAKAETGEVNNKITDEKIKQVDAVGSRPSTPAGDEAIQAADADTNPSLDTCPALMASYPRQSNKAYDFLKINYLDVVPTVQHATAQKNMSVAVPYVESMFFLKADDATAEKQIQINAKRNDYMADMVADVLTLNIGVQQNLVEDAMSIPTAPTSGCNLIDDLNVSTMIMISTAKQAMADIALQIQMLEFEGVQRVLNSDVVLLDKPDEKQEK